MEARLVLCPVLYHYSGYTNFPGKVEKYSISIVVSYSNPVVTRL